MLFICLLIGWKMTAQTDSTTYTKAVDTYFRHAGSQSILYTGKEQQSYLSSILNHPYLVNADMREGEVEYDGIRYTGVRLRLDLNRDELMVLHPNELFHILLQPDKVGYANLHGYHIRYFLPDARKGSPPRGYYLYLYEGQCQLIEKQTCLLIETTKDRRVEGSFRKSVKFWVLKDDVYYPVKSKGSVLKVFDSHRRELNQYIRQHKLDFKRDTEQAIEAVIWEYERLNLLP